MTNQTTPVQGGATEEQIEAAARAVYDEWRSPDYFTWEQAVEGRNANPDPTFQHIVDKFRAQAKAALIAAFAVQEPSEERKLMQSLAKWVGVPEDTPSLEIACEVSGVLEGALAALSVPASADPADEHHDAEDQQAESEDHAARLVVEAREFVMYGADLNPVEADRIIGELCDELAARTGPENHAATVTGDREKLIQKARHMAPFYDRSGTLEVAQILNLLADALAAPVEATVTGETRLTHPEAWAPYTFACSRSRGCEMHDE